MVCMVNLIKIRNKDKHFREYGYFDRRITFRWGLLPPTTKYHRDILFGFEDLVGR